VDIASYSGEGLPDGGLLGLIEELVKYGVFTDEIFSIWARRG
jgi:hypothetical protein